MLIVATIPDVLWSTLAGALCGLFAGAVVAFLTQRWIEKRERRNRRDDVRRELYFEVIDLVLDNELALAERGADGVIPDVELQTKRLRVYHRLKLLGSDSVNEAYDTYRMLVFKETAHPTDRRPDDPEEVVRVRDTLMKAMANDVLLP